MTSTVPEPLERAGGAEAPLLDVRDLRTYFKTDDGIVRAVDGVSFSVRPGQTLGVVGESGSGKSVTMMSILSLNPKPGRMTVAAGSEPRRADGGVPPRHEEAHLGLDRAGAVPGREPPRGVEAAAARAPRERDLDDLPGPDDVAEPGPVDRQPARRGGHAPPRRHVPAGARARDRRAAGGRDPAAGAPDRRLPAPVLGRHAPAGDDRDGAHQRPGAPHRGRADHRARRDDAGADPRPHPAAPGRPRDRGRPHHPRPRGRRGDGRRHRRHVRGPRRRAGARVLALRAAAAPVHVGAARLAPAPRRRARAALADPGAAAVAPPDPRWAAGSGRGARTRSTAAVRELPEATPASFDPEHLDACFLPEERKRQESERVVRELGLDEEAA